MQLWLLTASPALWMAPPAIVPAVRVAPPVMRVHAGGGVLEDSALVVQGGSRCTWSDEEEWNDQVQVVLSTEGHTLDAEIEQTSLEHLDVARLVDRLRREEPLAPLVGCGVDEPRRGGEGAALTDDELRRRTDRLGPERGVLEHLVGLA